VINTSPLTQEFLAQGRCDSCPVLDMHGHYGPYQGIYFPNAYAADMIKTMDNCGVKKIVCSSHASLVDPKRGNLLMESVIAKHPSRFLGYWTVNPNYPDTIAQDLDQFGGRKGFLGFKFLSDYHKYPVTGPAYEPVLEYAANHRLVILMHTWGHSSFDGPDLVRRVAERYPEVTFLMGHSGYGEWEKAAALARGFQNVYLELTAAYAVAGVIELFVEKAGSQKIVFGTDLPWFDPHCGIGCVLFARITDDDRRNILYRNARQILTKQGFDDL